MSDSDHKRWSEDLAAYMLGALDPAETAELERHLEGCEHCRQEMRWLDPAVHTLPEAVERREPPRRLREGLMAEVRADARRAESEQARAEGSSRSVLPAWLRGGSRQRGLRLATGFAAAVLLVGAAAGYEIGKEGSGDDPPASTLFSRQDSGVVVKMVAEGEGGTLHISHLHQPRPGKVLEAWVLREGEVEAVPALFVPDRNGQAETRIADMDGVEEVMVTEEPRGGSEEPTSKPIVEMSVPQ
jgi:anti-sigma-K factor RskA